MNTRAVAALCSVFIFCCSNVYLLEVLIREDPGVGNLIVFFQFAFLSVHGLVFTSKFGTVRRHIPLRKYATLVLLFFVSSIANNYVFNFHIPMPLHMVFRSGSLLANMALGIIILDKKYDFWKYASVGMITVGIIVFTVQSGAQVKEKSQNSKLTEVENEAAESEDLFWWFVGIFILTFTLFLSARIGLFQETLYQKYGKHAREALFYTHVLPLPMFALIFPNIWNHWVTSGQSEPMFGDGISTTRFYLLINSLSQCLCVGSVYFLTAECSSLTVTLTVTLRKFVSLVFSILYFKHPFTLGHWSGTLLIFIGTLIFTELLQKFVGFVWRRKEYEKTATSEAIEVTYG